MQPIGDLVAVIEQATGIDVAVLDVGPDEHGLTMRDPERDAVFIGVACTRNPMRQRSTLAHELAHVLFEDWTDNDAGGWSDRTHEEIRADAFARHLLVPVDGLREFLGSREQVTQSGLSAVVQRFLASVDVAAVALPRAGYIDSREQVTQSGLSAVVQRFLASPAVAAIALQQAGYIDAATKQEWMGLSAPQLAVRFGWSDQYRALQADSGQRRAPQRLLARAIKGYAEGVIPAQTIATLRGIPVEAAEAELREAGVVPAERLVTWADPAELPDVQVDLAALDEDLNAPDDRQDGTAQPEAK
jgi:Zn-dependent peptidase ImmA (M78 family)